MAQLVEQRPPKPKVEGSSPSSPAVYIFFWDRNLKKENKAVGYIKESMGELKKVTWPKKDEIVNSTMIVIVVVIIFSVILGVFDIGVSKLVKFLFKPSA